MITEALIREGHTPSIAGELWKELDGITELSDGQLRTAVLWPGLTPKTRDGRHSPARSQRSSCARIPCFWAFGATFTGRLAGPCSVRCLSFITTTVNGTLPRDFCGYRHPARQSQ